MSQKSRRVVGVIQARQGSSRLPGKVLMPLWGEKSTLEVMVDRLAPSNYLDHVIIATSTDSQDNAIEAICIRLKIDCYRGSETDVLSRYYEAAQKTQASHIVRLTADCPLQDYKVVDHLIQTFFKNPDLDYAANALEPTYPDGFDAEIFTFQALETAYKSANKLSEREHVTPYINKQPNLFNLLNVSHTQNLSHLRLTLDEPNDYKLLRHIANTILSRSRYVHLEEIATYVELHPEWAQINQHIERNSGYKKSLRED